MPSAGDYTDAARGVAQLGSAPRLGRGGRRFKSAHPDHMLRELKAQRKADGVVNAAHFDTEGNLLWVRAFERRGPTWSDLVLLDRQSLIQRLEDGKRFYVGSRHDYNASEFDIGERINLKEKKKKRVLVVGKGSPDKDQLEGLPPI